MKVGWIRFPSTKASKNSARMAPLVGTSGSSTLCSLARATASSSEADLVKVHAGILLDGLHHGEPLPVGQVDLLALVGDFQAAADLLAATVFIISSTRSIMP